MARTNGAPEFLRRAEAADAGKKGYTVDWQETNKLDREPARDLDEPLTADDYGGRRNAERRVRDLANLSRMEEAIGDVAASNVSIRSAQNWEDKPPLDDIAERIAKLTFGDMILFAQELLKTPGYEPTDDVSKMASFLWQWSKSKRQGVGG